jgi:AcrR family transcriptional regulator
VPRSRSAAAPRGRTNGDANGGSERRAALVDIAADLFAQRGFRSTTVREIADAAGVLSGSLYHHFDSKESIIDELLSSYTDELLSQYRTIVTEGGSNREVLTNLVRAAFGSFTRHRAAITVFQNERQYLAQFPRFAYLVKTEQTVQRIYTKVLRDGRESGEFRADLDPKLTYRFVRDAIWVSVRWYRPGGRLTTDQLADEYLRLLFDGLTA